MYYSEFQFVAFHSALFIGAIKKPIQCLHYLCANKFLVAP